MSRIFHFGKGNLPQAVFAAVFAAAVLLFAFGAAAQQKLLPQAKPAAPNLSQSDGQIFRPPRAAKRKFINSGILRPKIAPPKKQEPDFPAFSAAVFVPKFFDAHERFERVDLSSSARLRFVTAADFFPFNYIDKSGSLAGYNIDLVRALCTELRLENICRIEALPWEELPARLQTGAADALIAGLAPSAENRAALNFSRAYMRFPARFIALRHGELASDIRNFIRLGYDFSDFLRLRGSNLRIGAIKNTAHEKMLKNYFGAPAGSSIFALGQKREKNAVQILPFADQAALIAALAAKKIDLAFGDGMGFALLQAEQMPAAGKGAAKASDSEPCCVFVGGAYMGSGSLGQGMRIAVPANNKKLAAALNYALQQLERKGRLAELYLRYFPVGFY